MKSVFLVVVLSLVAVAVAQQAACKGPTKVTIKGSGDAQLRMQPNGDFEIAGTAANNATFRFLDEFNHLPFFPDEVGVGFTTAQCPGAIRSTDAASTDIQGFVNGQWVSLTQKTINPDIKLNDDDDGTPISRVFEDYYELTTCGIATTAAARQQSCAEVLIRSALSDNRKTLQHINYGGAEAIFNRVRGTKTAVFGIVRTTNDNKFAGFVNGDHRQVSFIVKTTHPAVNPATKSDDEDFSGDFDWYEIESSGYVDIDYTDAGEEWYCTTQLPGVATFAGASATNPVINADPNNPAFARAARGTLNAANAGLYVHHSCNDATHSCTALRVATPVQVPAIQTILPGAQMVIDTFGGFHFFYAETTNAGALLIDFKYLHCPYTAQRVIPITLQTIEDIDVARCHAPRTLFTSQILQSRQAGFAAPNSPFSRFAHIRAQLHQDIVVAAVLAADSTVNAEVESIGTNEARFRIYQFEVDDGVPENPWIFHSTVLPRQNDPAATAVRIFTPIDFFDMAISPDDSSPSKMVIAYTSRAAVHVQAAPSSEDFQVRAFICEELSCEQYQHQQIAGSRTFQHKLHGSVPRGVRAFIHPNVNSGWPVFAFAIGTRPSVATAPANFRRFYAEGQGLEDQVLSQRLAHFGGPPGIIHCNDAKCVNAQFVKSSDALSGHQGDFILLPSFSNDVDDDDDGLLLGSIAHRGNSFFPTFQWFTNSLAAPEGVRCNSANTGKFVIVDNEVYLCSKLEAPIAPSVTTLYQWGHVIGNFASRANFAAMTAVNRRDTECEPLP